jgi:ssDNA-binding Zn-finger/Zn-ribbon topoisomerase 1
MEWNAEQVAAVFDSVYSQTWACPTCGGILEQMGPRTRELNAIGSVGCSRCGAKTWVSQGADPMREKFREYTAEEKAAMIAADKAEEMNICPVDGTPMKRREDAVLARMFHVIISCPRCSRSAQYQKPR